MVQTLAVKSAVGWALGNGSSICVKTRHCPGSWCASVILEQSKNRMRGLETATRCMYAAMTFLSPTDILLPKTSHVGIGDASFSYIPKGGRNHLFVISSNVCQHSNVCRLRNVQDCSKNKLSDEKKLAIL